MIDRCAKLNSHRNNIRLTVVTNARNTGYIDQLPLVDSCRGDADQSATYDALVHQAASATPFFNHSR